jgi:hypothetical protein
MPVLTGEVETKIDGSEVAVNECMCLRTPAIARRFLIRVIYIFQIVLSHMGRGSHQQKP